MTRTRSGNAPNVDGLGRGGPAGYETFIVIFGTVPFFEAFLASFFVFACSTYFAINIRRCWSPSFIRRSRNGGTGSKGCCVSPPDSCWDLLSADQHELVSV